MSRKTTGTTTRSRKKAAVVPINEASADAIQKQSALAKPSADATNGSIPATLEEQIRLRAYELYLERKGTNGNAVGDQNQDWLLAEREVLSRQETVRHA